MSIGQQLLDVPFDEMVSSLGTAIADAQFALDKNSINILKIMGQDDTVSLPFVSVEYVEEKGTAGKLNISDKEINTSMIGAGFQPTFYQFAETIIEVKIAISMSYESEFNVSGSTKKKTKSRTTTVDASYSNKYNYSAEGSSLLRTRLVPVPPNPMISQIIEMRNRAMEKYFEIEMQKCTQEIDNASTLLAQAQEKIEDDSKKDKNKNGDNNSDKTQAK